MLCIIIYILIVAGHKSKIVCGRDFRDKPLLIINIIIILCSIACIIMMVKVKKLWCVLLMNMHGGGTLEISPSFLLNLHIIVILGMIVYKREINEILTWYKMLADLSTNGDTWGRGFRKKLLLFLYRPMCDIWNYIIY